MHTGAIEVMIYIVNSSEEPRSCKSRNYHPLLQAIWAGQRSRFRKNFFFLLAKRSIKARNNQQIIQSQDTIICSWGNPRAASSPFQALWTWQLIVRHIVEYGGALPNWRKESITLCHRLSVASHQQSNAKNRISDYRSGTPAHCF